MRYATHRPRRSGRIALEAAAFLVFTVASFAVALAALRRAD